MEFEETQPNEINNTININTCDLLNQYIQKNKYNNDVMLISEEIDTIIDKLNIFNRNHLCCSDTQYIVNRNENHIGRIKQNIQNNDYITFVLSNNVHYVMGIIFPKQKRCLLLDSLLNKKTLRSSLETTCSKMIQTLFDEKFEIIVPKVLQQTDGTSCGKYCIYFYFMINFGFDSKYIGMECFDVKKFSYLLQQIYVPEFKRGTQEIVNQIRSVYPMTGNDSNNPINVDEEMKEINEKTDLNNNLNINVDNRTSKMIEMKLGEMFGINNNNQNNQNEFYYE